MPAAVAKYCSQGSLGPELAPGVADAAFGAAFLDAPASESAWALRGSVVDLAFRFHLGESFADASPSRSSASGIELASSSDGLLCGIPLADGPEAYFDPIQEKPPGSQADQAGHGIQRRQGGLGDVHRDFQTLLCRSAVAASRSGEVPPTG